MRHNWTHYMWPRSNSMAFADSGIVMCWLMNFACRFVANLNCRSLCSWWWLLLKDTSWAILLTWSMSTHHFITFFALVLGVVASSWGKIKKYEPVKVPINRVLPYIEKYIEWKKKKHFFFMTLNDNNILDVVKIINAARNFSVKYCR